MVYIQWNTTQPLKTPVMPSAITWMDLEIIILSEIRKIKISVIKYHLHVESNI